ncbi:hypothetical protein NIASO_15200 [Niabella soli DSM 19437]|uniref:Uncharacterized protein n=1 Tax=Niabella soli DSM 19437 TaxID=929713 RepID=W0F7R0_9BACT|nr:hypothetical protein NIASO_15200 [Niabella soli DSM 19437]
MRKKTLQKRIVSKVITGREAGEAGIINRHQNYFKKQYLPVFPPSRH